MALKKIRDSLAKKDSEYANRKHATSKYNVWQNREKKEGQQQGSWGYIRTTISESRFKGAIIGLVVIVAVIAVMVAAIAITNYQRGYFSPQRVTGMVETVTETPSNRAIEITFEFFNDNRATLRDAQVAVQFGSYFVPQDSQEGFSRADNLSGLISIGDINGNSRKQVKLVGYFIAPEKEIEVIKGTLRYNVGSQSYEEPVDTVIKITSSPIVLDVAAPQSLIAGNIVDIKVVYRNKSDEVMEGVSLTLDYPEGFVFRDASRTPTNASSDTWVIGTLDSGAQDEVSIRGILTGEAKSNQPFTARIVQGDDDRVVFAQDTHSFTITPSPLEITQRISGAEGGVARASDRLRYTVSYKNNGNIPLRDAILRVYVDGSALDLSSLLIEDGGFYDASRRLIEWKAADIGSLKVLTPGETNTVNFGVTIKNRIPLDGTRPNNLTINTVAEIESLDIPDLLRENKNTLSSTLITKVGTKLLLEVDTERVSGPFPLSLDEPTRYQITLKAGTVSNDISGARVTLLLPGGVAFAGQNENEAYAVVHNERTNEVSWDIGTIGYGAGVINPFEKKTFFVELRRGVNQGNKVLPLLSDINYTATDNFTDTSERVKVNEIFTGQ